MKKKVLLMIFLALPGTIMGQPADSVSFLKLTGVVRDPAGRPLKVAEISVGDSLWAFTDAKGEFTLDSVPTGSVQIDFRRVGYKAHSVTLQTRPKTTGVSVAATLVPNTTTVLGTVVIRGKAVDRDLLANGFYKRATSAQGYFFSPERMQKTQVSIGTMLNEVPQLRLGRTKGNVVVPMAAGSTGTVGTLYCKMDVFLDGVFVPWATETGIDDVVAQYDVKAVEVYPRESSIPPQLRGVAPTQTVAQLNDLGTIRAEGQPLGTGNVQCGAILLWTKSARISERAKK